MLVAHNLGFFRISDDRELKKAVAAYWKGDINDVGQRPKTQCMARNQRCA